VFTLQVCNVKPQTSAPMRSKFLHKLRKWPIAHWLIEGHAPLPP